MKPSQNQLGRLWTDRFKEADRAMVCSLIDSLDIHDHAEIMSSLAQELRDLANDDPSACPIMLGQILGQSQPPALGVIDNSTKPGRSHIFKPQSVTDLVAKYT